MFLVTGGAGFIGSNLVAALAERGSAVAVCDRLGVGDNPTGFEAVVHMGAISDTTERDGDALVENNFRLSMRLWRWCAAHGVPLIYASSAATYGGGEAGFEDDGSPAYLDRLRPLNGYGWSKHLFDRWVAAELAERAPRPPAWAGLKFFNVYGPNEYHKGPQASVAYHLFQQVSKGEPARLFQSHNPDYPDGGQLRDFIWVGDCVEVMLWLLERGEGGGLFNVGSGKARSFADLARALFEAIEQPQNVKYVPTPEAIRDKYQYFTEARMERLRAAGYDRPFTSLEEGVRRYVRDHLATEDPYR